MKTLSGRCQVCLPADLHWLKTEALKKALLLGRKINKAAKKFSFYRHLPSCQELVRLLMRLARGDSCERTHALTLEGRLPDTLEKQLLQSE